MRLTRIAARGFRNLVTLDLELPAEGAVFLGHNGQGKTNLLEAISYPVLFRSIRRARDAELVRTGETSFHLCLTVQSAGAGADRTVEAGYANEGQRKRVAVDRVDCPTVTDGLGAWLAVVFQPTDLSLVAGGAGERRQYLDRVLSLADRSYFSALRRYRAALEQRNAAFRRRRPELARPFEPALASAGAELIRRRIDWIAELAPHWVAACADLGEPMPVSLVYRSRSELTDPEAWPAALAEARPRDEARATTTIGPHRDDLGLFLDGLPLRSRGSTGQLRTAAVALKLCERETLVRRTGLEPALLLDDVFAELDRNRQDRLARMLGIGGPAQIFVTTPRADELPPGLGLPVFAIRNGTVLRENGRAVA